MSYRKLLFSLCLIWIVGNTGIAQTEIKSKVTDFLTYLPIENASVYIKNTTIGVITNVDGKFLLNVPQEHVNDTLIISSIGYESYKSVISEFKEEEVFLEEDIASLDEVVVVAETRPKTGNDIMLRALEELPENLPDSAYIQKGFLRHKERNKKQYKWLIESAITVYDSSYESGSRKNLRINVDETRKSYDLREVDSLFTYASYLKSRGMDINARSQKLRRDTIRTASLVNAIKWNDTRVNGLENLFKGKLNMIRNANMKKALLGEDLLERHQFELDTILVDDGRKIYKIRIFEGKEFVGLNTPGIYNEGFEGRGWIYIYYDNYAIKRLEYELVAASDAQKRRSKSLFGTQVNHKLVISYKEYGDRMYPNYFYYETPKLVKIGDRSSDRERNEEERGVDKDEQYYYTTQEILFTEIIQDPDAIAKALKKKWSSDIFSSRPYNEDFWENYNVLLESEEEDQLIQDLTRRATLFKQ
ncbi:carboxypeptidase-like regulatory domain-containing protein [Aureitalea sp. L0-47]|uniref:carboxypeptidase-like regulatory domain-containing protein n=1 Tax=Aureitalea sp. L0-47 TaxID=2816962 RepID=UPI00223829DD|nr:carboxypeptidase-like regulatory domain-containing protein [Aureitalea sp. L0-47]MCW5520672.1 carboxypeptidase-like regulatory domain-containing protein [Aureitalea sp. L0-47]